jgi:hypothetical protein
MTVHGTSNHVFKVLANTTKDGSGVCNGGSCPTIYDDGDTLIVQGYTASEDFEAGFIPDGETVVSIPKALIRQLLANPELTL